MKRTFPLFLCLLSAVIVAQSSFAQSSINLPKENKNVLSLAGIWNFKLDPMNEGITSQGSTLAKRLPDEITLPGSTDMAGKGYPAQGMTSLRLTRSFQYKGVAWYEKEIFIPDDWKDKDIKLFLERAHWKTSVWVNGHAAGSRESLSVPHVYDITSLVKSGKKNTLRIQVDNDKIYDIGFTHALSEETQTNWNGIIGKIQLQAFDKVHLQDVQVYPNIKQKEAKVQITVSNHTKQSVTGVIKLTANHISHEVNFSGNDSLIIVSTNFQMGDNIHLWDEFHPALYHLQIHLEANGGNKSYEDFDSVTFGMRDFSTQGTQFLINGRPVFIRADVNSSESPLTGYPAMDKAHWMKVFKVCKAYGLNAMRFHSWCPPETAFEVADEMGFYLQIENSDWRFDIGKNQETNQFLAKEADNILKNYGNHPSFTMFCEGNELVGPARDSFLTDLISHWEKEDPRHLYTGSSGYPVLAGNEYDDFYGPRSQHWKEGLKGLFNKQELNTNYDYAADVAKHKVPVISHEVGQWCVYPDFEQIPKYTGVLKPYNYELFRESLRNHHLLNQAQQFLMASGKFQVIQKKEELEALLRTPGLGGYQLLQLQDFPGQGTAPVGVVDIFWNPKPYTSAEEFHQFQSARVPLLRTSSFTWTNDQTFTATAQFANYGEASMKNITAHWSLKYTDGRVYAEGDFGKTDIPVGTPFKLGDLSVPLNKIQDASQFDLSISIPGTDYKNHWNLWVYPKQLPDVSLKGITVTHEWNNKVKNILQNGGKVLLLADTSKINSDVPPGFSGISWNTVWSGMPPNLLGILCDPDHAALKYFPTEYYSNWQWWDLVSHSRPMLLDSLPVSLTPLVQMIPDWNKNNKIGLIFEAKVGKGKLLMTSIDLEHNLMQRPVARQMLYNLEKYVSSEMFVPLTEISTEKIDLLFDKSTHPLLYQNESGIALY
jgi:hypothetical protein